MAGVSTKDTYDTLYSEGKKDEQSGTWVSAAGAFTGGLLESLGYGKKIKPEQKPVNYTPWIIGGGVVFMGIILLVAKK